MPEFCHLHSHTQFSLLDGAADITSMIKKAKADGQKAVAITDHGNMFGAFKFFQVAKKEGIKPIIGCEVYVVEDRHIREFRGGKRDKRYHQLLLAKNKVGYHNLSRIVSTGFIDGMYSQWPRVDKEVIRQHSEGLVATTCCIGAQVPQAILFKGEEEGERVFKEWLEIFGRENYFVELQRHGIENIDDTGLSQEDVNQVLLKFARKYDVKVIATNDSHYVDQSDAEAHDILLCLQTGADISADKRFKFPNDQFWFKSQSEMIEIFQDIPEAIDNTALIGDMVEEMELVRDILLPKFPLPPGFTTNDEFLRHVTYEGAQKRYGTIDSNLEQRLNFELSVIENMGFAGYFLVTQDLIAAARERGVIVGPGRGSAAGSAVAYATKITDIDPIEYNLLFERFLNPERVSMPDIDIDFDDVGRSKVIDYVVEKYGRNQVAQIITYGTMAAKSSVKDVGRVLNLPHSETNKITKMIPDGPGVSLKKSIADVKELKDMTKEDTLEARTLAMAQILEGSVRHRGIHAAGVIIAPDNLLNHIPVCTVKDSPLLITQYDGKYVESAGMLKMDFLGLKTLSILNDCLKIIKKKSGKIVDLDEVSLEDEKTYELFQRGETIAVFQFESPGMQKHLKSLKPSNIEDLIAMNALYRPGPMDQIPTFVKRKHGLEPVKYPHQLLEGILKPTYGIMVYQEQIMQAAQILGDFTLGQADMLRRAMGKKKMAEMDRQKVVFKEGAAKKGISSDEAEGIFNTMAKFAEYGFNRSHAAAYSVVAYRTAYLKAHYPAEFMASVLTHNMNDISKINFFLSECNRMGLTTLAPCVNESEATFTVTQKNNIRFGMAGIKGVGGAAVECLLEEREKDGPFKTIFDLTTRVNLKSVNKKSLENLAMAGSFDSFENTHRSQYLTPDLRDGMTGVEKAVRYGQGIQKEANSMQGSLFANTDIEEQVMPQLPVVEKWSTLEKLNKEREVAGIFLSGHPLQSYALEIGSFANCNLETLEKTKLQSVAVAVIVAAADIRMNKSGNKFGIFTVEDTSGTTQFALFRDDFIKFSGYFEVGKLIFIKGSYQLRWKSEDQYELKVKDVSLLSELKKQARTIIIDVSLDSINDGFVQKMTNLCENNKGKMIVTIRINDAVSQVRMHSTRFAINHSRKMFEALEQIPGISYQLSK